MGLSNPEILKGIGSMVVQDYDDANPLYFLQGIDSIKITPKIEKSSLVCARGTLDSDVQITGYELSFTAYDYSQGSVAHMTGGELTEYTSNAAGEVVDIENVQGNTCYDSTKGVTPTVSTSGIANIKYGEYVIIAKTSSTVTIKALTDVSFNDGTNEAYEDDDLVIADDVSISNGVATEVPNFGFKLMGGSAVAMTVGDTCTFRLRRPNKAGWKVRVGGIGTEFTTVSAVAFVKRNNIYKALKIFKFKIAGLTLEQTKEYSKYDITADLELDSGKGGYFDYIQE